MIPSYRWLLFGLSVLVAMLTLLSCNRYDLVPELPPSISQFDNYEVPPPDIPDQVIEVLDSLDVEVDTAIPPRDFQRFQATYQANPYLLEVPFGTLDRLVRGDTVAPYWLRLYRYDNNNPNAVTVDYCHAGVQDLGIPAQLFGDSVGGTGITLIFTVDATKRIEDIQGEVLEANFQAYQVITGNLQADGIANFQVATVILDKTDPNNIVMPPGERRVFVDGDGLASRVAEFCD